VHTGTGLHTAHTHPGTGTGTNPGTNPGADTDTETGTGDGSPAVPGPVTAPGPRAARAARTVGSPVPRSHRTRGDHHQGRAEGPGS
jgi:hypothetical protein